MRILNTLLLSILTIVICAQETVYAEISGGETGHGILKYRGDECFAIIPAHLLEDNFGTVDIYGEGSVYAEADKVKTYTSDLAILRFIDETDIVCTEWKVDRDFDKVIEVVTQCKLEIRQQTGGARTIAVTVTDIGDQFLQVRPNNFREELRQGMSGSSLFTEYNGRKVYLGMLQTIDSEANTGDVLMADEMEDTLDEFFNPRKKVRSGGQKRNVSLGVTRESLDFKFELVNVERNGGNVNLKLNVTSLERDKIIRLHYGNIHIFDDQGLETRASSIVVGSKTGYNIDYNLVHGISVPLEIRFENISSSTDLLSKIRIGISDTRTDSAIEIRDIELEGSTSFGSQYDGNDIEGVNYIDGFKFELLHVSKAGQEVICKFKITSEDRDKPIYLPYNSIFLYDDKGFETRAERIIIGSKSGYNVEYNMVHGIAVPVDIKFSGVNSTAENIALLKVGFKSGRVNSEYQQRNIPMTGFGSSGSESGNSNCSDLYFYRMKGFMQCSETISLMNHDQEMIRLEEGTRYKTTVCDDREFHLKATIGRDEIGYSSRKPQIQLGKDYYFKIGCSIGVSKITERNQSDGEKELNKKNKYKMQLQPFQLKAW